MRILLDTNVVVSALLFTGSPRDLLRALCISPVELWTSRPLLQELAATLAYDKLSAALARTEKTLDTLVQAYARQVFVVPDIHLLPVDFPPDPRDAHVIAAADAARVDWLISGDHHLLDAKTLIRCEVVTVAEALARLQTLRDGSNT